MGKKIDIVKDLKTIISIQEKIIKANESELDSIDKNFFNVYDHNESMQQWAYWYRAWSEYLEKCIQEFRRTKKKSAFNNYFKSLNNPELKKTKKLKKNVFDL